MPQATSALRFCLDHIIARQHGGTDEFDNVALACGRCNRHKGPNIAGIDPDTGTMSPLFHPRDDNWDDHFKWDGPRLVGLTTKGRATIVALAINLPERIAVRTAYLEERPPPFPAL